MNRNYSKDTKAEYNSTKTKEDEAKDSLNSIHKQRTNIQDYYSTTDTDPFCTKLKQEIGDCGNNLILLTVKQEPFINDEAIEASNVTGNKQEINKLKDDHSVFHVKQEEFHIKDETTDASYDLKSSAKRIFNCAFCDYKCTWKSRFADHVKTHTGEKTFQCSFCNYKCIKKQNLTRHVRTHTGEKPFSCTFCDYKTTTKLKLKCHLAKHTGENLLSCTFCDYKSAFKSNFTRHLAKHKGVKRFSCTTCDYKTAIKTQWKCHLRKHSIEKLFGCTFCDYKSAHKSKLKCHLLKHTGEKSFNCTVCGNKYTRKKSLVHHMKSHDDGTVIVKEVVPNATSKMLAPESNEVSKGDDNYEFARTLKLNLEQDQPDLQNNSQQNITIKQEVVYIKEEPL